MTDDKDNKPQNRRSGSDRRSSPPDRRRMQELFNHGDEKIYDRRSGWQRRKGPRRNEEEPREEW